VVALQRFNEFVGQESITQTLGNAIYLNKSTHTVLFIDLSAFTMSASRIRFFVKEISSWHWHCSLSVILSDIAKISQKLRPSNSSIEMAKDLKILNKIPMMH
jgi:hypothetical protein